MRFAVGLLMALALQATAVAAEQGATGDIYGKCCLAAKEQPFYAPVIQERAWTLPIWYRQAALDFEISGSRQ